MTDLDEKEAQEYIRQQVIDYYTAAASDYKSWSRNYNMHFGYWRPGINPFNREAMLNELNLQVFKRLGISGTQNFKLVDLGGGTGATARSAVASHSNTAVDVVTIVPRQISIGNELNKVSSNGHNITMHCTDFTDTHLPSGEYDGAIMIESACHAIGPTKESLLKEAHRLLKPGGTLVMVDAMLLRELPKDGFIARLMAHIYRRWCTSWAVPEMCRVDLVSSSLVKQGFSTPKIEDWSWNVTPSVAHVPLFASYFTITEIIKARGKLPTWRWRHIVASFLTPLLGLRRCTFTYSAIISKKQ